MWLSALEIGTGASLRYRNRAKITVRMCEQKPYPVQFSCQRKSYTEESEHSLIFIGNLCTVVKREIEDSTYGHFFWKGKRGVLS